MANLIVSAIAEWNGKALTKGEKQLNSFEKSIKNLGRTLGVSLSAAAVISYGKASVKAFAADDKAAQVLSKSLDNLGLSFANPAVKIFISDLESQYHVLDDKLRPAYQKLLTTTGDWRKSQELLKTALDLSAMSGTDVESVVSDLSRAYAGNTKGLQKYGLGLTKAELTAMSFEQILAKITEVSKGQATLAANTYAGALDALTVSASNAQETIGKGLVQAFTEASGSNGIGKMQNGIADLAAGISDAIIGTERLVKIFLLTADFDFKGAIAFYKETKKADMLARQQYGGAAATKYIAEAQAAADKLAVKRARELAKAAAAKALAEKQALKAKQLQGAIDKANAALGKSEGIFDIEKIQVAAALTNQAEALGKATTFAQALQIANDTARLRIKQDILALEDAIASKDEAAITAATAKLNEDIKIYNALSGQKTQMAAIESILAGLKPKDLIDQNNLDEALRKIKEMLALLAQVKTPSVVSSGGGYTSTGSGGGTGSATNDTTPGTTVYPTTVGNGQYGMQTAGSTLADSNINTAALGGVVSVIGATLKEYLLPTASSSIGAYDRDIIINVAGSVMSEQDLINVVQNAVQVNNRYGNNLNVAGAI